MPLAASTGLRVAFGLARLAALRLVLEVLVGVEQLLAGGPDKRLVAFDAHQILVSVLHAPPYEASGRAAGMGAALFLLATDLLAAPLARQGLFGPPPVARLQIEAVLLDVLDDVFLLYLPLEAAEGIFDRLALLDLDLGHDLNTPPCLFDFGFSESP